MRSVHKQYSFVTLQEAMAGYTPRPGSIVESSASLYCLVYDYRHPWALCLACKLRSAPDAAFEGLRIKSGVWATTRGERESIISCVAALSGAKPTASSH